MTNLLLVLIPIVIVDVLNPVLLAGIVFTLGEERPYLHACMLLLGHTVAYFAAGILFASGLEALIESLADPKPIDFVIEIAIALGLLFAAYRSLRPSPKRKKREFKEPECCTPLIAFAAGFAVNLLGLPFAVPYFAVVDQILKADLSTTGQVLVLAYYNALYALPFTVLILIRAFLGEKGNQILQKVNLYMDKAGGIITPLILGGLGLLLLADAGSYFIRGVALIEF